MTIRSPKTPIQSREAPKRGFPFFVRRLALGTLLLGVFASSAVGQEVEGRVWLEALDFLAARGASAELDGLRVEALRQRPQDLDLAEAFLERLVARKDRAQLNAYVQALAEANACRPREAPVAVKPKPPAHKFCAALREIWEGRLGGLLFFESSAPRWERARRSLETGDCRSAQAELREIEAREGGFPDLLSQKIRVAECFGETENVTALRRDLEKLRF